MLLSNVARAPAAFIQIIDPCDTRAFAPPKWPRRSCDESMVPRTSSQCHRRRLQLLSTQASTQRGYTVGFPPIYRSHDGHLCQASPLSHGQLPRRQTHPPSSRPPSAPPPSALGNGAKSQNNDLRRAATRYRPGIALDRLCLDVAFVTPCFWPRIIDSCEDVDSAVDYIGKWGEPESGRTSLPSATDARLASCMDSYHVEGRVYIGRRLSRLSRSLNPIGACRSRNRTGLAGIDTTNGHLADDWRSVNVRI
ncbi:hypothetical protein C8F01DRAFT_271915 [Mycena amicta]|nr:hypothetical protein C8F01DRAFT_271915 [Mycena amicta]